MNGIAVWLALLGYIAVWCGIFGPLAWLIRVTGRASKARADAIAFAMCYLGAVLAVLGPVLAIAASNPSFRRPAGEVLDALHERCSAGWCSPLLAVLERPSTP